MENMNEFVQLAIDGYKGSVKKYSVAESQETIREALIEMNGGKTAIDPKAIAHGKCEDLFAYIEEVLPLTIAEGLQGDEYFNTMVDFRNVKLGDENMFVVGDNSLFVVAEASEGNQAIRRQRLGGVTETPIKTRLHIVRIYEELNRVLAGRVDFNDMIARVQKSFQNQMQNDIYALWNGATADQLGGATYFPGYSSAGTYDEDTLLDLVAHVEAAAGGRKATILCTAKAARKLAPSIQGADSKSDLYNLGYYGKFYGTPVVVTPQRHAVGSTNFLLADDIFTVVATDDKPLKFVYEGNPLMIARDPFDNMDLTQEYVYADRYGLGLVLAGNTGIGRYKIQ